MRQRERLLQLLLTIVRAVGIATGSHRRERLALAQDVPLAKRDLDAPAHVVVVHLVVHDVGAARQRDQLDHLLVELDIFAGIVPATIDGDGRGRKGRPVAHALLPREL